MSEHLETVWFVESSDDPAGHVRLVLVRARERRSSSLFRRRVEMVERTEVFSRAFQPLLEKVAMERYRGALETIAQYARDDQFGCFVITQPAGPTVDIILYERTFDGSDVRTEELARRAFDAGDDSSLVASTEFLADLRAWADARNEERDASLLERRQAQAEEWALARDNAEAARELNEILSVHARPE